MSFKRRDDTAMVPEAFAGDPEVPRAERLIRVVGASVHRPCAASRGAPLIELAAGPAGHDRGQHHRLSPGGGVHHAASAPLAEDLDERRYDAGEGPCADALATGVATKSPDLGERTMIAGVGRRDAGCLRVNPRHQCARDAQDAFPVIGQDVVEEAFLFGSVARVFPGDQRAGEVGADDGDVPLGA